MKIFSDITRITSAYLDVKNFTWVTNEAREFTWDDLFTTHHGDFFTGDRYFVSSAVTTG